MIHPKTGGFFMSTQSTDYNPGLVRAGSSTVTAGATTVFANGYKTDTREYAVSYLHRTHYVNTGITITTRYIVAEYGDNLLSENGSSLVA